MKALKKVFVMTVTVLTVIFFSMCKGPAGPAGSGAPKNVNLTLTVKGDGAVKIGGKTVAANQRESITVLNGDSVNCELEASVGSLINTVLNNYSELKGSDGEALYRKKEETIKFPVNGTSNLTVFFAKDAELPKEQCIVTFRALNEGGSIEASRNINGEKYTIKSAGGGGVKP